MLRLENVQGQKLSPYLDAMGELRITVFREYPYLYDGTIEYEREYLRTYVECPSSFAVLAFHGHAVIGVTTCLPMADAGPAFREVFDQAGMNVDKVCYFGESLLLQQYRGRGIGRQYFQRREAHARQLGLSVAAFCAVDRPPDHPLRPKNYQPLDEFWKSLGYTQQKELQATFEWKEVNGTDETSNKLTYWTKDLSSEP